MTSGSDDLPPFYSFDRVAQEYEATRVLPETVADALAARIVAGITPPAWILDAGVGTGRIGRALVRQHTRTVGVDVSRAMLERLRTAPVRPHLALADLRYLPFASATFDRVLLVHVLHLIADWRRALSEVWRSVAPGGGLFLGFEEWAPTVVREFYLDRARELGVSSPRLGASAMEAAEWLTDAGAVLETQRPDDLCWEFRVRAADTLAMLERRTYSMLWRIPEETHRSLLKEARAQTLERFGTLNHAETIRVSMLLHIAWKR